MGKWAKASPSFTFVGEPKRCVLRWIARIAGEYAALAKNAKANAAMEEAFARQVNLPPTADKPVLVLNPRADLAQRLSLASKQTAMKCTKVVAQAYVPQNRKTIPSQKTPEKPKAKPYSGDFDDHLTK